MNVCIYTYCICTNTSNFNPLTGFLLAVPQSILYIPSSLMRILAPNVNTLTHWLILAKYIKRASELLDPQHYENTTYKSLKNFLQFYVTLTLRYAVKMLCSNVPWIYLVYLFGFVFVTFCLQCGRPRFDPWVGKNPLEKGMMTHSSILAWRIPETIQSMGLQRVRYDWATFTSVVRLVWLLLPCGCIIHVYYSRVHLFLFVISFLIPH